MAMSDARSSARKAAVEKYGDALPLQLLARAKKMMAERGYRPKGRPAAETVKERPGQLGDDVFVPHPGQDVGSGAHKSWRDPHTLGELAAALVRERGWGTRLEVADVGARWPQIVGETVAANAIFESFEGGVLTIRARTVGWETQLRALLGHLDARLAKELGEGVVKEIVIGSPLGRPNWNTGGWSVKGRGVRDTYD
ncbi:putative nucleic acid-binding Zn ribbon protein [Arcanobacterium wilhelmae]|uniref:Nucleic acid-binding Zn ribbon protein n=2 Tax=Arcanobacterium wilhelmae TaxID=1803177 RepID=A0ABT9NB42_9ACTO|nr:putative nucleic acid-binding Zn ribbon protein [Arcanobacterium wilhelmae]